MLTRAVIHSGVPGKPLLFEVTGKRRSNLSFFLPSNLPRLAGLMRVDARRLLWEHTAFPYIVAFMSPVDVNRFMSKALEMKVQQGSLSSLIQSVTQGLPALRFCDDCVADDVMERGESYWHRDHCLPATHVCVRHGTRLRLGDFTATIASRAYGMGLPQHQEGRSESLVGLPDAVLTRLAYESSSLLRRVDGHTSDWPTRYRAQALLKGFVMTRQEVASGQLAMDLQSTYSANYLSSLGCAVNQPTKSWPALMVRERNAVPFAPVKHVLIQVFFDSCDSYLKTLAYRPPGKVPRDSISLDEQLAQQVRKAVFQANLRNVQTTVTQMLKDAGHWSAFRHDRSKFPRTTAALATFRATEASERKLGGREAHQRNLARRAAAAKRDAS